MHRIAPDLGPQPVLNAPSREPYVDYSDSQLNEDELMSGDGFAIGAKVAHQTFGRGVVRRHEGRGDAAKVWVNFERSGLKLLVLKFANLRPVAD
jgi:DNA helicase-2/ATP-dependent DNA helicase PcrA